MEGRRAPRRAEPGGGLSRRLFSRRVPPPPGPGGVACPADTGASLAGLYLIGALPAEQTHSYEGHLLHCPACQTDCDRIGPAVDALATLRVGGDAETAEQGALAADDRP
ncbi:hypothetical protein AB0B31_26090 [Catellatospora citrea]|uniref:hypothetical protein n=1 Tax=Catellatospora citrea TaxID=53366 RepID=UPI0033E3F3E2